MTMLGTMNLGEISTSHKRATINQNTTFQITNQGVFEQFTSVMITSSTFQWQLQSKNLRVQAAKFPVSKGIKFDKTITLQGKFLTFELLDACLTH